ncbi:MAG TPA: GDP-mannose 4,6-dehydratase [Anaerolineales bacterium]|nr:GDP-mannose 4,6-dehydratase [Anaerolineales bacterium]
MEDFWTNKKVLVTGAGGFIGSHLVERLAETGASVRVFVRYNSRGDPGLLRLASPETLANLELVGGDLRDPDAVRKVVSGCQIVFHLGALISIPYSYRHPAEVAETNFMGTLNVLIACRDLEVQRLIHTSTSEVYGTAQRTPIDESHPLQGQSPYSASKIGADKLVESFYCTYQLPAVTIRPFNTYGPRQSARAVIPTIITQALANRTIHLGNLDAIRDFTYVDDTVNGFMCAASVGDIEGGTFNLGTGTEIKVGDLAEKIIRKVGTQAKIEVDSERIRPQKSEVLRLLSDNSLARSQLGWSPSVSLDDGLDKTIEWIKGNLDRYRIGIYEL